MTPLDRAHAAMTDAPEDEAARLAFYDALAQAELFLLLAREPEGDAVDPELVEAEGASYVLAFDLDDRLGAFVGGPAPYAALSGRALAAMLAGQGLGLGLNLGDAPSAILLPSGAMDWLAGTLADGPSEAQDRPVEFAAPRGVPQALLTALDGKLAVAVGLARFACLVSVSYASGRRGHLLGIVGAVPGAEPALGRAMSEALVFSGLDAGELDVAFFAPDDPVVARLRASGLRIDIPDPVMPEPRTPTAPGMDPSVPPKLR